MKWLIVLLMPVFCLAAENQLPRYSCEMNLTDSFGSLVIAEGTDKKSTIEKVIEGCRDLAKDLEYRGSFESVVLSETTMHKGIPKYNRYVYLANYFLTTRCRFTYEKREPSFWNPATHKWMQRECENYEYSDKALFFKRFCQEKYRLQGGISCVEI